MATAAPAISGLNPAYLADPSLYSEQLNAQQQQALAQALIDQGMAPMGGTQMAGNVALRNSPTQSMAKIAALLSGQNLQQTANQSMGNVMSRQNAALLAQFTPPPYQGPSSGEAAMGMGATQGSVGPTVANAQLQSSMAPPQQQRAPLQLNGETPMASAMSYSADPAQHMKLLAEQYAQTPEMKMAAAAYGVGTPGYMNALREQVQKAGYIAPAEAKAANLTLDRFNRPIVYNPQVDKGITPSFGTDANGFTTATSATGIPGYNNAAAAVANAESGGKASGKAPYDIVEGYDPTTKAPIKGFAGNMLPPVNAASGRTAQANSVYTPDSVKIMDAEAAQEKDPAVRARLQAEANKARAAVGIQSGPALGDVEGANKSQTDLQTRYGALRDTVGTIQTTNSYLDNIKQLSKTAVTGPFSDKTAFVQGLVAPFSTKADASLTDKQLLDKYSNQIVARLSTGGLGTDAARTILGSAYPGAKMTEGAISEAVDNIKAVNNMQSAKLSYVQGPANAKDAAGYQQKEQQFDQVADPRVWQLHAMNPDQARAFLSKMAPDVRADLVKRATALKSMGVF